MDLYGRVSRAVRRILDEVTPVVEPVSIDEAFLDLSGVVGDLEGGRAVAADLKERIHRSQRLTASVGVAPNKFLAKVASDLEKPDGLVLLRLEDVPARLWPQPVRTLWGVGPRTAERLARASILTVGDVLRVDPTILERVVGSAGADHLRALARGEDTRPVEPHRDAKSISEERTYTTDLADPEEIDRALLARAESVARELRRKGLVGRTVHLKVRTGDFTTWTRSHTLPEPTDLAEPILRAVRDLLRERIRRRGRGLRLIGVGVSGLEPVGSGQGLLFAHPEDDRARRLARASDAVRDRVGENAVTRARLLRRRGKRADGEPPELSSPPCVD
jgi:nucleotidyltransferase/DNA polymerase involved in DNA repair